MTNIFEYMYQERTDLKPERTLTEDEKRLLYEVVYDFMFAFDTYGVCLGSETYFRLNDLDLCLVFPKSKSADLIEVWDATGIHKYGYMLPQNKT